MKSLYVVVLVVLLGTAVAIAQQPAPSPSLIATGKDAYTTHCAACHGPDGDGKGPVAFAIKPPPRNFQKDPFKAGEQIPEIFYTITNGLPNTKMIGYGHLSETQRWGLAYYVRSFRR